MARARFARFFGFASSRLLPPLAAALLACSGDSDSPEPPPAATVAPTISGLSLSPPVAAVNEGGGSRTAGYEIDVFDPDSDVARVVVTVVDEAEGQVSQVERDISNPLNLTSWTIGDTVAIPTTAVATYALYVQAFDAGGRGSNVLRGTFAVVEGNPIPAIASLSPETVTAGSAGFTLAVTGSGFLPGSIVLWNGSPMSTTYVDGWTLWAEVDSYRLHYAGAAQVTVANPTPGGGTSAPAAFIVEPPPPNPAPTMGSVTPNTAIAASGGFTLTVAGSGFVPISTVYWNASPIPTTYVDGSTLRAQVESFRLYYPGNAQVTVSNPSPGGGTSAPAAFTIEPPPPNPVPSITALSPDSVDAGVPSLTLTVTGSGFVTSSRVFWNTYHLSTTFVDARTLTVTLSGYELATPRTASVTVYNPTPGGGTSSALTFTVTRPVEPGVRLVNLKANDLAWDPYQQKVYVSVPSTSAMNPNTVTVLDPFTGELTASVFVGSEPDRLGTSDDGRFLYVGLRGASYVERLTLPELAHDLTITLERDPTYGAYYAGDLQVAPGSPSTVAVARVVAGTTSTGGGIVVYDDATQRPTVGGSTWPRYDSLQWGRTTSDLYTSSGYYDLYTFFVDASGVVLDETYGDALSSSGLAIRFDRGTGLLYAEDGRVIDPATGLLAGTYPVADLYHRRVAPDSALGSTFFASGDSYSGQHVTVGAYDLAQYYLARSTKVSYVGYPARRLVRWGPDGLAFLTPELVVLLRGSTVLPESTTSNPVPALTSLSPSSAEAGSGNLRIAVSGVGFVRGSTVRWNGNDRATTFVSSTDLVAFLPASDLAEAGSAEVVVASPAPGGGSSSAVTFTVAP